ncbi:MAG: CheF family chemotaxis protein, partial [Candidatus Nanohaloarchaea archaeon]
MSESEYKIADTKGRFLQAVKQGRRMQDADWSGGRIILSNRRIILVTNAGKQALPLSEVVSLTGRYDVNQTVAEVGDYVSVRMSNESVYLLSTGKETEQFEYKLFGAMLDQAKVQVLHPAVKGGVVQDGTYEQAKVKIDTEPETPELNVALADGTFVAIEIDDVGQVDSAKQEVSGTERPVLKVEHTEGETSVQTYFAGQSHTMAVLESLFSKGMREAQGSVELSETEK